jgi:hypothetical protein
VKHVSRTLLLCAHLLAAGALLLFSAAGASFNTPTEPRISLIRSNTGIVRVTYEGQTNFQYIIRASTNLPNWFNLTTNVASTSQTFFTDKAATNSSKRFYSAVAFKSSMFYLGQAGGSDAVSYLLYVRTNNHGTLLGLNTARQIGEAQDLYFDEGGVCCGELLSFASGCLTNFSYRSSGTYTNSTNSIGLFQAAAHLNSGLFRNAAGFYTGTCDGSCPGTAQALVAADGSIAFYVTDSTGAYTDAWLGMLNSSGLTLSGNPVPGRIYIKATLNSGAFTISGIYSNGCLDHAGSGNLQLSIVDHAY